MGRPAQCADLIRQGHTPSEIAQRLGISPKTAIQYLYVAVGQGLVLFSDIVFSIPHEARSAIEKVIAKLATDDPSMVINEARACGIDLDLDDLVFYLHLRGQIIGDLYFYVIDLEKNLHSLIEGILKLEYGEGEEGWWRRGIPEKVRIECAERREQAVDAADGPYCYTDFIHLKQTLEDNWTLFSKYLPKDAANDKKVFMKELVDANAIRNKVMHPVRGNTPDDEDFKFIMELRSQLAKPRWQIRPG